jgi:hypothetical protein
VPRTAPAPLLSLVALALSACSKQTPPAAAPADPTPLEVADAPPTDPEPAEPKPPKDGIDQQTAAEETTRILHEVAKARKLSVKSAVKV